MKARELLETNLKLKRSDIVMINDKKNRTILRKDMEDFRWYLKFENDLRLMKYDFCLNATVKMFNYDDVTFMIWVKEEFNGEI